MLYDEKMELTIEQFHLALLESKITVKELVAFYLSRIEQFDAGINAIICINPNALQEAENMDIEMAEKGISRPLFGVPVILKDNVDTEDMPTTAGSMSLEGVIPKADGAIVRRLKEAGAIILAKSNLHEFAIWGETISSIKGQTYNPYDLTRTPGGSSGGTGAGIACNFGLVGIGTDTINSIRSPASANNLVGIRPTIGMVSRSGIVPYSYTQDTAGPIARTVSDAVRVLDVIKGYDVTDQSTAWGYVHFEKPLKASLDLAGLTGKRIGVLKSFFGEEARHDFINMAVRERLRKLEILGAEVIILDKVFDSEYLVDEVSVHLHDLRDHLNAYLGKLPAKACVHCVSDVLESGLYHPGIEANLQKAMELSTGTAQYRDRLLRREKVRDEVMQLMASNHLDALAYPHQKQLTCKVGDSQNERNGVLASVAGFPSICVPAGFSDPVKTAPVGVPIGMEIMGRPFGEASLIEIAHALEMRFPIRKPPVIS